MRRSEPIKSSFREHDGIVFAAFHFAQPRINIAAQIANVEVGTKMQKLRLTTQASGADARARAKIGERRAISGHETVANIGALANRRKR